MSRNRAPWLHALRLALLILPVLGLVGYAVLGPSGFLALQRKQRQVRQELATVKSLEAHNRDLNHSIRDLSSDPGTIEGIAREQLHLTRPGEIVYTYPTTPAANGASSASLH